MESIGNNQYKIKLNIELFDALKRELEGVEGVYTIQFPRNGYTGSAVVSIVPNSDTQAIETAILEIVNDTRRFQDLQRSFEGFDFNIYL